MAKRKATGKKARPSLRARSRRAMDPGEQGSAVELALDRKLRKRGWWFDVHEADRVCTFVETYCRHSKGEHARLCIRLEPWQRMKVRRLFGWRRPDGTRRYRRTAWWLPRKNGKSTLFAALALYLLMADGEMGSEVYSAASQIDQARMVFGEARRMVEQSPDLEAVSEIRASSIYVPSSGSVYRPLASKARSQHGLNIHGVIIDELHAVAGRDLYDVLTSASGSRRQPLEMTISTAGDDIGSFGAEVWDYTIKVRDGALEDPEFLAVVYAADPSDDWTSEATWRKANPNLGVSVSLEYLRGKYLQTKGMPSASAAFKQLYLNIWAQSSEAWLDIAKWRACLVKPRPLSEYKGRRCWGGLDLSSTTDLTAMALVFDMGEDDPLEVACFFWVPADTAAERQRADDAQYVQWIKDGYIRATPGNAVDYDLVERDVARIARFCTLEDVAFDRWGASQIVQRLELHHGIKLWQHGQGYRDMSAPSKELERLILRRGIRIVENPVLTWMASSVCVQRDAAGNVKPVKLRRKNRIDGIVAVIMALGRATQMREQISVYQTRGVIEL